MRKALAIVALLSLVAAAPTSQPATLQSWRDVLGPLPAKSLPSGGVWSELAMDGARKVLDERLPGAQVRIRGAVSWQKIGGKYEVRSAWETVRGIYCHVQGTLADGDALQGLKDGQHVVFVGTIDKYQIGNTKKSGAPAGTVPFLHVTLSDVTLAKR